MLRRMSEDRTFCGREAASGSEKRRTFCGQPTFCGRGTASFEHRVSFRGVVSAATVCGLPAIPTKAWGPPPGALTVYSQ